MGAVLKRRVFAAALASMAGASDAAPRFAAVTAFDTPESLARDWEAAAVPISEHLRLRGVAPKVAEGIKSRLRAFFTFCVPLFRFEFQSPAAFVGSVDPDEADRMFEELSHNLSEALAAHHRKITVQLLMERLEFEIVRAANPRHGRP